MPGQIYWSPENIGYALSLTDRKDRSDAAFWARALALAELLEALVLATELTTDIGNAPIDEQISAHINTFNLADVITPTALIDAPLSEHTRLMPSDYDALDISDDNLSEWFANLGKEDLKTIADSFRANLRLEPLYRNPDEVVDFSKFFLEAYAFIDANPGPHSLAGFSSYSEVFDAFYSGELSKLQAQEFWLLLAMFFQLSTDTAVTESFRQGDSFMPLPLQTEFIISSPRYRLATSTMLGKAAKAHNEQGKDLRDLMFDKYSRKIEVPLLFGYIISNSSNLKDIFSTALSLRDERDVIRYRKWCFMLDQALEDGDQSEAIRMIDEVDKYVAKLSSPKGWNLPKVDVQIAFPPSISFGLPQGWLGRRRNHLLFLRRVYQGTLNQLKIRDKIIELLR